MSKIGLLLRTHNLSYIKIARALSKELGWPVIDDAYTGYDVVIALDSTSNYITALAKAKAMGAVTAAFIHDIRSISHAPIVAMDAGVNPTIQRLKRLTSLSLIKPFIDKVLTPSQASAKNIKKYAKLNACVVPLGIDRDIYRPINTSEREISGVKFRDDEYLILTVATKKYIIRHAAAIFSKARERLERARLVVRGPCDESLRGVKGIVCLPPLPEELMPRLYSIADVFLYPSLIEGFGLPVLEAMSCGLPVVAYREDAIAEVVGDAGVLVEPKSIDNVVNALIYAINNKDALSKASIKRAAEFTWRRSATKLLRCLLNG
ncbi:glycosyltransferase [Pyrobaculum sp.]|uniref:glycosyltransferase n=1 Tax=Pyrobaculum sp. TaxID=2004705 RepID=UPI0031707F0E